MHTKYLPVTVKVSIIVPLLAEIKAQVYNVSKKFILASEVICQKHLVLLIL